MKLHELEKTLGATHRSKKLGRGPATGHGKTAGKGHKGQKARSGVRINPMFEGGQNPLYRRLPNRGFNNAVFRKEYAIINLDDLNTFKDGDVVTPEVLLEKGIIKKLLTGVKVLSDGECDKKLTVKAHKFSKKAIEKLKKAGSSIEVI